jgi:phytoene dehydrogenase-like protein
VIRRHFDIVVLGRSIGALATAALLARRDFTVLVLGHGGRPASYRVLDHEVRRRSFTFLAATSPAWARIVSELAQSQTWRRKTVPLDPMLQVVSGARRLDVPPDVGLFAREIHRELPEVQHVVDDLYGELARVNAAADEAFQQDLVWPPGTFWERRETNKLAATLPYIRAEPDADLLAAFPRGHFFRQVVQASALFATHMSSLPPPFAVARLHGSWTRGLVGLPRGEDDLVQFLIERVEAHGGACRLDLRASSIVLHRGAAAGVVVEGDDEETGADWIVTDLDGESLASFAGGQGIHKSALREWPRITSTVGRFVVSFVVRREGLPEPLGPEVLLLPRLRAGARAAPAREARAFRGREPIVHLQRLELEDADLVLLVAEILLPDQGAIDVIGARAAVLEAVRAELPFFERHLLLVDSPHDGLPIWSYRDGVRRDVARPAAGPRGTGPEPMERQLEVDPPGYIGLAGEPIRGPIDRTLLVGRSVLPGLGQEGAPLAAWGAARLVTKGDRRRQRMRRDLWTKMELG